ncbi:glycosyltransferase family 2 protein [Shewanella acanthi]|uniref:glycosyltransferase family 2 protein n=1 Tax=Shewanella acanthi TaxID=2864212 RepID=UPI001C65A074|nr:glycosyltransferase family 2 protein [Shewanella acanthi]QYJ79934.1 glycosyltransferase family 2 protein [Shewanella acanthi]
MAVFISVVSHNHSKIINEISCLELLAEHFNVVIKSNTPDEDFSFLENISNINVIRSDFYRGFGENNNLAYKYCKEELDMKGDDYFIVLNPDVSISHLQIFDLLDSMKSEECVFSCINLFKNSEMNIYDNSVRKFPTFKQFTFSLLGLGNSSVIDRSSICHSCEVDWAAGSFLCFQSQHYSMIKGFDEKYFMYCEDVDICYRSMKKGVRLKYYPDVKAIHYAAHNNRKVFTKHFYWHLKSALRFLCVKNLSA